MIGWTLGLISVIIASLSQILLKKAADTNTNGFLRKFLNFKVISAYILLFASMFVNTFVLQKLDLKYIPCITATSFLWILIFSNLFLGEKPTKNKVIGIILIMIGVIMAQF